jgi:hypothetical protein
VQWVMQQVGVYYAYVIPCRVVCILAAGAKQRHELSMARLAVCSLAPFNCMNSHLCHL